MPRLDESVRVCPDGFDCVITRRVEDQLNDLSLNFLRLLRKQGESMSRKSSLNESGETWIVDLSLTFVDFRVWST